MHSCFHLEHSKYFSKEISTILLYRRRGKQKKKKEEQNRNKPQQQKPTDAERCMARFNKGLTAGPGAWIPCLLCSGLAQAIFDIEVSCLAYFEPKLMYIPSLEIRSVSRLLFLVSWSLGYTASLSEFILKGPFIVIKKDTGFTWGCTRLIMITEKKSL